MRAWIRWAGLGLPLVVLAAGVARTNFLIDDAFISFRYARNWAELGVPAYNPGTDPPVEGYSNFLWVLVLRICFQAGVPLEIGSRVVSVACGAATVVLVHRFLRATLALPPHAVALGSLGLAAFPPFVVWCTGGLETAAFTLFVFATFALLVRRGGGGRAPTGIAAGVCALAVALLRVEGFLWVLVLAACARLASGLSPGGTAPGAPGAPGAEGRRRRFGLFFAVYLSGFGAYLLWRHATYDEWLANTVQAKAGLSTAGLVRGLRTSASYLLLLVTPLVALAALPWTARGPRRGLALGAAGMVLAFLGHNTLVGGDWMPFFRFLAPASPFLALLIALGLARLGPRAAGVAGLASVGLALAPLFGRSAVPPSLLKALYFRDFKVGYETELQRWRSGVRNLEEMFVPLGKGLGQIARPGDSLTFGAIGAVGWYSGLVIHDRNGLVDREVARRRVEGTGTAGHDKRVPRAWFLDRKPTIFHAVYSPGPIGPEGSPTFQQALGIVFQRVWGDGEGEQALFEHCLPEVHALRPQDGLPRGSSIMILRATRDRARARAFWARYR